MKRFLLFTIILIFTQGVQAAISPKSIFKQYRKSVCLVSFYQNTASDSRIGSFNKIKRYRIGLLVSRSGLIMASSDVYPVSLDIMSGNGSLLSGKPSDFKVRLWNGTEFPAEFLGKDDQAQVAFIQLQNEGAGEDLPYIQFSQTNEVEVADSIYVLELLSQRYNFQPLFTPHSVDAVIESPRRMFLVNNSTTALSAGGVVLNSRGEAIGVTMKQIIDFSFRPPEEFEDFQKDYLEIAPSEWFVELIADPPDMQEHQVTRKSWLGIRMQGLSRELEQFWSVPQQGGVVVNEVYPESPAEKAGLRSGDVILSVNDSALLVHKDGETEKLRHIIRSLPPGETVDMNIFRNGKTITKKVKLGFAPKSIGLAESYPLPQLGFEIRELTRDILYQQNLPLSTAGVFVYQVDRASPAGIAGLSSGSIIKKINDQPVKNLEAARKIFEKILKDAKQKIMLRVLENRSTAFVFIDLSK